VTRVRRHALNVRICHWINLIAVGYLLVSGIHIFLDFPELYWGKTGFRGHPAAFRLEDWGISWEQAGEWGDRRWGRNAHFTFAWVFVLNGLAYVGWSTYRRHFRQRMLPAKGRPAPPEPGGSTPRYGTAQGIAYLSMIFVVTPLMFLTGIAQMPAFTAISPWLIDMFGGRQTARTIHMIATVVFVLFALVHVGQVIATGFFRNMRGMITGRAPLTEE
jgi:thiosulfate reductase cytochrome b subunit